MNLNPSRSNPDRFLGFLAQDWETGEKIRGGIGISRNLGEKIERELENYSKGLETAPRYGVQLTQGSDRGQEPVKTLPEGLF